MLLVAVATMAQEQTLLSPNGNIRMKVRNNGGMQIMVENNGNSLIDWSPVGVVSTGSPTVVSTGSPTTTGGNNNVKVKKAKQHSVKRNVSAINYKCAQFEEEYNELALTLSGDFDLVLRAYNDGCAYRWVSKSKKPLRVKNETLSLCFPYDGKAFVPYVNDNRAGERYCYSFESYYDEQKVSEMFADSLAITPLAVCSPTHEKVVVMETAVENYPGMFLSKGDVSDGRTSLKASFAPLPLETVVGGFDRLNLIPTRRADYIADINPQQALPWRMILVANNDVDLLGTNTPYSLAPECRLDDTSWIKPGKVAWDWWNNWNIYGVDFRAGINTPTYKYYIDFASRQKLEYIIVDEGWSSEENLLEYANNELSIPELVAYGKERGVGVILWSSWRNLIKDMERNMKHYAEQGVKGFKVDFFDRDDQEAIRSSYEIAACAAKYHLLVDYHGLKPSGVQRAYPNVVNFEGVKGLENCKWEPRVGDGPQHDMPRYDVTIPYLRMLPGPLDYTPGAMHNALRNNFFGNNDNPMSQGTRVHQIAMYVIFEAPLQMLADSPTHYMENQECTDFISLIPTTFDETLPIAGEMGEYVAVARRKGNTWYVAAMNNWTARDITIPCSFLNGTATLRCFSDGINADREAMDYKSQTQGVDKQSQIHIHLAPAGGWAGIISVDSH